MLTHQGAKGGLINQMYRSDPEAGKLLFQIMIEILSRISTPLVRKPPLEIGPSHELTSSIYDSGGNT